MRIVVTFNEKRSTEDELDSLETWIAEDAIGPSYVFAPQELLLFLLIGGVFFLTFAPWVAAALVLLFVAVVSVDDIVVGMLDAWLTKRRRQCASR